MSTHESSSKDVGNNVPYYVDETASTKDRPSRLQRWSMKLHEPVGPRSPVLFMIWAVLCLTFALYLLSPGLARWCSQMHIRSMTVEQRLERILSENPLIDGHNDLLIRTRSQYKNHIYHSNFTEPFENGDMPGMVDLPRLKKGRLGGAFWSAFYPCPRDIYDFSAEAYDPIVRATLSQLDLFHRLSTQYPDYFTPATSAKDAAKHFSHGKLISPLAIEGLHQIGNSFSNLRLYHHLGVRYTTLTWNCHNRYADAAVLTYLENGTSVKAPPLWGGISLAGRALIKEMNRMGMLVDLSHVSEDTMRDALIGDHNAKHPLNPPNPTETDNTSTTETPWKGSLAPPIFSHSSVHALCPHPRNVPDSILHLVKARNSLVMVNFAPEFISCTPSRSNSTAALPDFYPANSTLGQVVRHIMHIGDLIGYDHVGFGSDFDGIEEGPRGLEDVSKFPDLVAEMLRRGVSDGDVAKVMGRNLLRVWKMADEVGERLRAEGMMPAEDDLEVWPRV